MIDVFISRPSWIPYSLQKGIDNFYDNLNLIQLNPRTIGQSDFPNGSPLDEIIKLMKNCKGTIVLGIPQIEMKSGSVKGQTIRDSISLATEWNHIEMALAYSMKHQILIIHDKGVQRGIFDKGTCNVFLYEVDMKNSDWANSFSIKGAMDGWASRLL